MSYNLKTDGNIKNHKSGVIHIMNEYGTATCDNRLTAESIKSGSIINVFESDNIIRQFAKATCKSCIRKTKPYMSAFAQYQD